MNQSLEQHTLLLYSGDFLKLKLLHPGRKPSELIRMLVHEHIAEVEAARQKEKPNALDG